MLGSVSLLPGSLLCVREKYLSALCWWLLAARCGAGLQEVRADVPGLRWSSLQRLLLAGGTEAWAGSAGSERRREPDRGSRLTSPPVFSCRKSRIHLRM